MGRKDKMGQAELRKHLCCNQGGNAIKFTKRIGERGEEPRPLLTGFYTEAEKVLVLKNAKKLDSTRYKNVNIAPDMTKKLREEEKELKTTAEERNRKQKQTWQKTCTGRWWEQEEREE
jgi:hypothetical protein